MSSRKNISKEPEEPEAILGDLDLESSSDSDSESSDYVATPIKYEQIHTGSEVQDEFNAPIVPKIEISDIGVDFGGFQNDLIDTSQVKVEGEVEESKGHGQGTESRGGDLLCKDCSLPFITKDGLRKHIKSHKPMPCQFEGCSIVSYTKKSFYRHRKTHNSRSDSKRRRVQVKVKVEESKGSRGDLFCEECNMGFSNRYGLKRHKKSHREMPCQIEGCSNVSYNPNVFYEHQKTHEMLKMGPGEMLYSCTFPGCTKVYKTVDSLKNHRKKLNHPSIKRTQKARQVKDPADLAFICNKCGRNYDSIKRLKIHTKNVCLNTTSYPCTFPGCNRVSKTRSHLVSHLKVHTGSRDYKCEFCGAGFGRKYVLSTHRLMVHLEKLPKEDREENVKKCDKMREDIRKYKRRYKAKKKEKIKKDVG